MWLDKNDIPAAAPWLPEVQSGIDSADNFIFILSPDSIVSDPCMQELAHAITNGKRLIPICYRKPDQATVPVALAPINYIFFDETRDFDAALTTLVAAMHTDLDWVRSHTRLQVRSLEWQTKGSDKSYLLGGSDLQGAEAWLGRSANQPIKPTELQSQYIAASRASATRAQRRNLTIATVVAVVASALAIVAVIQYFKAKRETVVADKATKTAVEQRTEADKQRDNATRQQAEAERQRVEADRQRVAAEHETRIATSGRLAATAISLKDTQLDLGSLLSLEADHIEPTLDSLNAELTLFQSSPDLITYLHQADRREVLINQVSFDPTGKLFATGAYGGTVTIWNRSTLRPLYTFHQTDGSFLNGLAFSPDGNVLTVLDNNLGTKLWKIEGQRALQMAPDLKVQPEQPTCVAFSNDGKLLAVGGLYGIQVWTFPDLKPLRNPPAVPVRQPSGLGDAQTPPVLPESTPFVKGIAFLPTTPLTIAYTFGNRLHIEDAATGASLGEIKPPSQESANDEFDRLAFDRQGTKFAISGEKGTVMLWSIDDGGGHRSAVPVGMLSVGDATGQQLSGLAFRPDGRELVTVSEHGVMRKWDVPSSRMLREFPRTLSASVHSLAFSEDGENLITGLSNGSTLLWSDIDPILIAAKPSDYPRATTVVSNENPLEVVAASASGVTARIVESKVELERRGRRLSLPDAPDSASGLAISADGRFLAVSEVLAHSLSAQMWDISGETPRVVPLPGKDSVTFAIAFNPAGTLFATGGGDGLVLWDTKTGQRVGANIDHNRPPVHRLAFTQDGTRIALVLAGGTVLLADVATQKILGDPIVHDTDQFSPYSNAVFDGQNHLFILNGDNGLVQRWDADPKDWAARACRVANRNLSMEEWKRYIGDTIPYHRTCPQFPNGEGVAK